MPTYIRYFEKITRGENLIDVNINVYLEGQKRAAIETGSSIEVRGTLDTRDLVLLPQNHDVTILSRLFCYS